MTILFLTPTYKPAYVYGGVTIVTSLLAESLAKAGHDVTVYTTNGNGDSEHKVKTSKIINVNGVKVIYFKRISRGHSHLSPGFWFKILFNVRKFDIVHIHSWWSPTIIIAAAICKLRGIMPVVSPHGMFCEYILNTNNKRKKQFLHYIVGRSLLRHSFLHVSTEMEWKESQNFLKTEWPGCIIPNLVASKFQNAVSKKNHDNPFVIGFLSRIDPKKRLDVLICALSKVQFDFSLQIAGSGDRQYINDLRKLAHDKGIADKVAWVGWKDNISKYEFYKSLDLFTLLSHNENFGVVVIESLSVGTPVLLSKEVGLSRYVNSNGLGWVIEQNDPHSVAWTLEMIYEDSQARANIQQHASDTIKRDYNSDALAERYIDFYAEITGKPVLTSELYL